MAIAFDAATDGGNTTGTNLTYSHTVTGSHPILFVVVQGDAAPSGSDDITSVTYNSVSMTFVDKNSGTNRFLYVYMLANPATGTNSVSVSCTASHFLAAVSASYTGAVGSGQPDAHNSSSSTGTPASFTTSLTTVADNCWVFLGQSVYSSNDAPTAGTGDTLRINGSAFGEPAIFDSNGVVHPAGSYSMTTNNTHNATIALSDTQHIMVSFKPFVPPALFLQAEPLTGVGIGGPFYKNPIG